MAVKYLVGGSRLLNLAVITYMSSPATFSMQTFLRKKESSAYASTTNSSVLCGLNPGLYHTGSGRMMELKEGIQMTTTTLCYIENDDKYPDASQSKKTG